MNTVIVEGSARHIHLSAAHLEQLFGAGYALRVKRELSQPGEFLSEEKLTVEGPKGKIERVSVLGPLRPATQVEVSMTDARCLGVSAPIRESGDTAGSAAVRLTGPAGSVELAEGCIVAKRHVHLTEEDASAFGIQNRQIVSLRIEGERGLVFSQVVARVSPKFGTAVHLDYDEMNAAGLSGEAKGELITQ